MYHFQDVIHIATATAPKATQHITLLRCMQVKHHGSVTSTIMNKDMEDLDRVKGDRGILMLLMGSPMSPNVQKTLSNGCKYCSGSVIFNIKVH